MGSLETAFISAGLHSMEERNLGRATVAPAHSVSCEVRGFLTPQEDTYNYDIGETCIYGLI